MRNSASGMRLMISAAARAVAGYVRMRADLAEPVGGVARIRLAPMQDGVPQFAFARIRIAHQHRCASSKHEKYSHSPAAVAFVIFRLREQLLRIQRL